ncbi:MAG: STAS domain-containing protein [Leptospiraceae bacterium]|nr:STAS domain-containing protein [Leptospiraceae bacterium]
MSVNPVQLEMKNQIAVLYLSGDVTGETEIDLISNWEKIPIDNSPKIIVNLQKAEYINSAGIAALITLLNRVNDKNGSLVVSNLNDHFRKVIETVGLTDFIKVFNTEEDALAGI